MKILAYPKEQNPYQELLYSKMPWEDDITYLTNILNNHNLSLLYLPAELIFYRLCGFRIFHLHFVYSFRLIGFPYSQSLPFRALMSIYFVLFILFIKILGYKLVWTAHDLTPHGKYFVDDRAMMRLLTKLANLKIVHAKSTIVKMRELGMNLDNVEVVAIGNYANIYQAGKQISKRHKTFTFGFFGKIREDKGILDLLETYIKYHFPNSKLYIVGECESNIKQRVVGLAKNYRHITTHLQFVPDDKVHSFINKMDVVVLPFREISTSSSTLLAMSCGVPVIAPLVGDIVDYPKSTGIYYKQNNPEGLVNAMKYALDNREILPTIVKKAKRYMDRLSWERSATRTHNLFAAILKK